MDDEEVGAVTDMMVHRLIEQVERGRTLLGEFYDRFCPRSIKESIEGEGVVKVVQWKFAEHLNIVTLQRFHSRADARSFGHLQEDLTASLVVELAVTLHRRANTPPEENQEEELVEAPLNDEQALFVAQLNDEKMTRQDVCRLLLKHCPHYDERSSKVENAVKVAVFGIDRFLSLETLSTIVRKMDIFMPDHEAPNVGAYMKARVLDAISAFVWKESETTSRALNPVAAASSETAGGAHTAATAEAAAGAEAGANTERGEGRDHEDEPMGGAITDQRVWDYLEMGINGKEILGFMYDLHCPNKYKIDNRLGRWPLDNLLSEEVLERLVGALDVPRITWTGCKRMGSGCVD